MLDYVPYVAAYCNGHHDRFASAGHRTYGEHGLRIWRGTAWIWLVVRGDTVKLRAVAA